MIYVLVTSSDLMIPEKVAQFTSKNAAAEELVKQVHTFCADRGIEIEDPYKGRDKNEIYGYEIDPDTGYGSVFDIYEDMTWYWAIIEVEESQDGTQ